MKDTKNSKKSDKTLTPRQMRFVHEYLIDLNGTQAAIRAGYAAGSADVQAARLLGNVSIMSEIERRMKAREICAGIDAEYVLRRLVEIDQMDVLDIMNNEMQLKPICEWPKVWRQYLSGFDIAEMFEGSGDERKIIGVLKKIKWPDKVKNLELLGKHVNIQAFKDKIEHSGTIETMTDEQISGRINDLIGKAGASGAA